MAEILLQVLGLCKAFGAVIAAEDITLDLSYGELHAVIGPNGAGKSTLLGQLAGEIRPDAGKIRLLGDDISTLPTHARAARGLARSFQTTSIFPKFSARDNVALAAQAHAGHSFRFWRPAQSDPGLRQAAIDCLAIVGLTAEAERPAGHLSHGDQRKLEVAMALAGKPRVLLLDEPTAGMGPEDSVAMVALLAELKNNLAILLVEHDMQAVFALADRISVLVYGRVIASGEPEAIRADPEVRRAYLGEEL